MRTPQFLRRRVANGLDRRALMALVAAAVGHPGWARAGARPPGVAVAVAASMQPAMQQLAAQFESQTGTRLALGYGASGNLARQIQQGLPVELFLSADESLPLRLADAGLTRDRGALYASGRLALFVAKGSPIGLDPQLRGLRQAWDWITKFAIANPELAPYGRAAQEVLQSIGLWQRAQPKLVIGESVAQATLFVATGSAQAGITALSLVAAPGSAARGDHVALPDSLHAPLRQRMVLLKTAGAVATAFYHYLQTPAARQVLLAHGFGPP